MVFRKNLRSLERRWEKISKFSGDLPSEQIFYRNIPLGAPDTCKYMYLKMTAENYDANTCKYTQQLDITHNYLVLAKNI